ncbi:MAG: DUF1343 domain-containing protein [Rhodocyclales bacterium]|nr:DUF1343 domain-containing protein [Rhodocyclales bacterium]
MRTLRFLLALLLVLPAVGRAQPLLQIEQLAPLAGIVEAEIAAGHIPGAVVLVGQGERIVYAQAFGRRALLPAAEPMTLDTVFDLASLTKVVATTPAILRLVERGRLALDAPAARYWPEFAAHGKAAISVRQLLAHTSGLPAGIDLRGVLRPAEVLRRLAAVRPEGRAGGEARYSDVNFAVLGELVRRVSGQPLDVFVERQVLQPLHMGDTAFLPSAELRHRVAPTSANGAAWRRGEVHDPLAARLGGVAGSAGLFGTAADLARFARALLAGGAPLLAPSSLAEMLMPQTWPAAPPRGLGWRLEAPLAANRAALPPLAVASHLGYTGTGLWLDPLSGVYVVILSSRLHPDGGGDAAPLRARVVAAVAAALGPLPPAALAAARPELGARVAPYVPKPVAAPVRTGIDVLAAQDFAPLRGLRVGLLTHRSGVDAAGRRSIDVLFRTPQLRLAAIFSPEHGLAADREGAVADDRDALTGLPVYSLYGATRRPTAAMLDGLDAVVVDLQDVGVRFYTYASTLAYVIEAAAERGLQVVVLDRPNPVNAAIVQGPLLDAGRQSFTGYWPLPLRHGLTLGEFARLFRAEAGLDVRLTVIPMQGYRRHLWYDDSGLPWLPPSPNLTSLAAATLYPGVGIVEGAEVSVGRGTDEPFALVGAPWIDGRRLADELALLALPGVRFVPAEFVPVAARHAGEHCHGVRIELVDRDALDAPALGVALAATLHRLYPQHFSLDKILGNLGSQATLDAIRAGQAPAGIAAGWAAALAEFRARAHPFLLYAD